MEKDIKIIESHIIRCRPGDWEHAKRVVRWVKELGQEREDLPLLITAGYIHDIGWRDLLKKEKITFEELLELEPKANENSEPYIRELLKQLNYKNNDIETILRLVSSADKHKSESEDEAIIVDADQLSKLDIGHLKEKYQKYGTTYVRKEVTAILKKNYFSQGSNSEVIEPVALDNARFEVQNVPGVKGTSMDEFEPRLGATAPRTHKFNGG